MYSSSLIISKNHLEQIYCHGLQTYPEECCGLLFGKLNQDNKKVLEIWETENSWQNHEQTQIISEYNQDANKILSKKNRFAIAPETLFQAQKYGRDKNIDIIGIYHSHPNYPAIPSEFDRAIAWSTYSYIIISVEEKKVSSARSWILDDNHQFQPEQLLIV